MQGGIDEAGRGPVIGPLVVAGVACPDPQALHELGCRDSKLLEPDRRRALLRSIKKVAGVRIHVERLEADDLEKRRARRNLNSIEVEMFRRTARALDVPLLHVDACDVDARRFGRRIARGLPADWVIVSEHRADANHPAVAAASIVAKVERDAAIAALARRLERRIGIPLGSGYPSDPLTRSFLTAWWERFGELPEGTRHRWKTVEILLGPTAGQATLDGLGVPPPAAAAAPSPTAAPAASPAMALAALPIPAPARKAAARRPRMATPAHGDALPSSS